VPAERAWPKAVGVSSLFDGGSSEETDEVLTRLDSQRLTLHLDGTPLRDAIDTLHDLTSLNIVIATAASDRIESEQPKVKLEVKDRTDRESLDLVLKDTGLGWEIKNGVILIGLEKEPPLSRLATARASLELRGATVPALVRALTDQGIETYASPSAWRSRGTFSLVIHDGRLDAALATIGSATTLRARIARVGEDGHEVVAIEGHVASVLDALRSPVPAFSGVQAEVRELRKRLVGELVERHAIRADRSAKPEELHRRERTVDLTANGVGRLLRSLARFADPKERLGRSSTAIEALDRESAAAVDERAALNLQTSAEIARLESGIAALDAECTEREAELKKLGGNQDPLTPTKEDELIARRASWAACRATLDAVKRESRIKIARLDRKIRLLAARQKELIVQEAAAENDVATLLRLERGMRLAEAESPD
jgi:hypothetical protein